jgi:hypothetical protein
MSELKLFGSKTGSAKTKCDDCGQEIRIGEWPFCPHGAPGRFGYDSFASYVDPNILPDSDPRARDVEFNKNLGRHVKGTLITSRAQRRKLMKEQNLEFAGRPYGTGGTEY